MVANDLMTPLLFFTCTQHLKHVFAVALEAAKKPPPPDVCPAQYFPAGLYSGSGAVGSGPTV